MLSLSHCQRRFIILYAELVDMSTHVHTCPRSIRGTCVSLSDGLGREEERSPAALGSASVHLKFLKQSRIIKSMMQEKGSAMLER